jgi:hypothetical protein
MAQHRGSVQPLVAGCTVTATKTHEGATASLTGGPATAAVLFVFTMPGGGTCTVPRTTDGTGAASASVTPSSPGNITCVVQQLNAATVVATSAAVKVTG